jgi:glycosyltransferase involved in cell wall biosynthesis
MPSTPRVSVITIFHNEERFLTEAVESVIAQTFPDWELLLVDDGSTDGSSAIATTYAERDPDRVRYLTHPGGRNRGMSRSRNLGIEDARGELVAFLDGDDVYLPPKLEQQVRLMDEHPEAAMVYGATEHWYSWSGDLADRDRDQLRRLGVEANSLVLPPRLVTLFLRREAQTPGTCGILVRRSTIRQLGGFEPAFRGMFEDVVFLAKICLNSAVYVESGQWDRYRQHSTSHSRRMRRWGLYRSTGPSLSYGRYLLWLSRYAKAAGISDRDFWATLRAEIRPYRSPLHYGLAAVAYHFGRVKQRVARDLGGSAG